MTFAWQLSLLPCSGVTTAGRVPEASATSQPGTPVFDAPWPLRGTPAFEATPPAWRERFAERFLRDLTRNVIDPWYPVCVDRQAGGFLCDFDSRWRPRGAQRRMLEFQARQTRTAARFGQAFPERVEFREIALHGLRYLREVMHDGVDGGWFWMVDRNGRPLAGGTKHAHGTAYVVDAGVEVYRLTGAAEGLDMACEAFGWLEQILHDDARGGYHGWATRDGRPILRPADVPSVDGADMGEPLGHGVGLKDANVHSDMLEAWTLLLDEWPQASVRARLAETYELVTTRFGTPAGSMHYLAYLDLTPVPGSERYGYSLQTSFRLLAAADGIGIPRAVATQQACAFVEHAIEWAWDDPRGGFIEAGPAAEPSVLTGVALTVRKRPWWVQTEGAKALLLMSLLNPEATHYRRMFERLVGVIDREFIDHRHGGWHSLARGDWGLRRRLRRLAPPKGDIWKDASHEADMYLAAARMLLGLHPKEPMRPIA